MPAPPKRPLLPAPPLRTFDPEEADFFYVPIYSSCFAHPIYMFHDFPWWYAPSGELARAPSLRFGHYAMLDAFEGEPGSTHSTLTHAPCPPPPGPRVSHMAMMTLEAQRWLALSHPYWNRSQGADHIWLFSHDEGACWAPTDVRGAAAHAACQQLVGWH